MKPVWLVGPTSWPRATEPRLFHCHGQLTEPRLFHCHGQLDVSRSRREAGALVHAAVDDRPVDHARMTIRSDILHNHTTKRETT